MSKISRDTLKKLWAIMWALTCSGMTGVWVIYLWHGRGVDIAQPGVILEWASGESLKEFSHKLQAKRVISSAFFFLAYAQWLGKSTKLQAGTYKFQGTLTPEDVIQTLAQGKVHHVLKLEFNLPEGGTVEMMCAKLEKIGYPYVAEIKHLAFDPTFAHSMGIPSSRIEGFVLPATYRFYKEIPSPEDLLKKTIRSFFRHLPPHYEADLSRLGLTLTEGITLASLIEKEASRPEEGPMIAEVILRRLKHKEPLGIDASVIYGLGNAYKGNLKTVHLRDRSNPYNSRIHKGLPPTPIASPSVGALRAVLEPTHKGYYYYVLVPGQNYHHFSMTLQEHNRHVRNLIRHHR